LADAARNPVAGTGAASFHTGGIARKNNASQLCCEAGWREMEKKQNHLYLHKPA